MPVARPDSGDTRVIAHLDLDCFYVQVEQRRRPELRGKPVAVVQYNQWKGGGLIAVSYEARKCGVLRCMRGDDAKKICPDIELLRAPWADGNAPLNWYRDAGTEVVTVLSRGGVCERASIDEVYLDITEAAAARLLQGFPFTVESLSEEARKTHILGLEEDDANASANANANAADWLCQKDSPRCDALLACGAVIVAELRAAVLAETQFTCSAGIAHNKMLAKLTSSMHKPAQQTVIPASYVPTLLASLPLEKIQRLGGKLGKALQEDLGVTTPGDLLPFSQLKLQELYGVNTGAWLWNMARGKNGDEVQGRVLTKSHSCSRAFPGPKALTSITTVTHWLGELGERLQEQLDLDLELHNRKAKLLVFHATVHLRGGSQPRKKYPSKSCPMRYGKEKILADARVLFERGLRDFCPGNQSLSPVKGSGIKSCSWAVTLLSIGAGDISAVPTVRSVHTTLHHLHAMFVWGVNPIRSFFAAPSRSHLEEASNPSSSLPASSPACLPTTTSASELEPCRTTEESGVGSRTLTTPSIPNVEETTDLLSDEGSGALKPCSWDADADSDADDVQCTPAFGSLGSSLVQQQKKSHNFQLFQSYHDPNSIPDGSAVRANPSEELAPTLIQCSPVEQWISPPSEAETCHDSCSVVLHRAPQHIDSKSEISSRSDVRRLDPPEVDQKAAASRVVELRLAFPPSTAKAQMPLCTGTTASGTARPTSAPKLKELWQRGGVKRDASSRWEYKQEEVDEEVLAQLPAEIQIELRNAWQRKRPSKRPSISDFFPTSSK